MSGQQGETDPSAVEERIKAEAAEAALEAAEDKAFAVGGKEQEENPAPPPEEYVQISKKEWESIKAAAAKTASYDQQLSKVFGTMGNMQRLVNGLQSSTQAGRKVEIPKDAFAEMERDFPELAAQTRAALEKSLSGMVGTGGSAADVDPAKFESMIQSYAAKREIEALEDAYPEWRKIVGAVDASREAIPTDNPFRKWLATKDQAYQNRLNNTDSAAVISRAIRSFQRETNQPGSKTVVASPRAAERQERIAAAVQPRGSNSVATSAGKTEDDAFAEGFASR